MVSRVQLAALFASLAISVSASMTVSRRSSSLQTDHIQPITSDDEIKSAVANQNVLLLLPAAYNSSDLRAEDNFSLFKLNTDVLLDSQRFSSDEDSDNKDTSGEPAAAGSQSSRRAARKINFLRAMWNKPKFSPLYLVNGTVCRFINSSPICTTLSTTGLLPLTSTTARPATPAQAQQSGNFFNSNNNNNPNNNFQQANNQNFRPAALLDDDPQDINVENANNSTQGSARQHTTSAATPASNGYAIRPSTVNRRPLNPLLSLRRPVRQPAGRGRVSADSLPAAPASV